jgi:hypothetical protein
MRLRTLLFLILALSLPACGGGSSSSSTSQSRIGPLVFALPFASVAGGEQYVVGLKNNASLSATAYVTVYLPTGVPYAAGTTPIALAPHAEVRTSLALLTGAAFAGGWVQVDTRDVTTLDPVTGEPTPVATSGYITPYVQRANSGGFLGVDESSMQGVTARSDVVDLPIITRTDAVQLINYSYTPMAAGAMPTAVSFDVLSLDAFGAALGPPTVFVVPGNGSVAVPISVPFDSVGSVRITPTAPAPAGVEVRFLASALEIGRHDYTPARYFEASTSFWPGQLDMAFDVEFGPDFGGNVHDFGVVMNNPTAAPKTVALRQVFVGGGQPMLGTPRTYVIRPGGTVFMRTTTADSRGLDTGAGETSFFADIFGDAFLAAEFEQVSLWMQCPSDVNLSARHFDRAFASFYRVLDTILLTNTACVSDIPIQQSLLTGLRNEVRITNPTSRELTVPIRGFTPGGTEYIVDPIIVPPNGLVSWTPDGTIYREDPSNPVGNPVPFMQFLFTPSGGAFFRGRSTFRDPSDLILYIRPAITRAN